MRLLCCFVQLLLLTAFFYSGLSIKVDPETSLFVDQYGRITIFHGVNVVFKRFPFHPSTEEFNYNTSLSDQDLSNLKNWGMKAIRLHVAWQGVQPQKGVYNYTYVEKLRYIIRKCNNFSISVLLDAHQDLYNRKFCGEGFPTWTAERTNFPFPVKADIRYDEQGFPLIEDCLKNFFPKFHMSQDVSKFQQDFITDQRGLLTAFIKMWQLVASYMQNEPNLIGYELFNEPVGIDYYRDPRNIFLPGISNNKFLLPAFKRLYQGIRAVDSKTPIYFQPTIFDWQGVGFFQTPGGQSELSRQVFSYHVYCPLIDKAGEPKVLTPCNQFNALTLAVKQANTRKMKIGGFMTEFGAFSNSTISIGQLNFLTDQTQKYFRSWTYWQFKHNQDITTPANPGYKESFYDNLGNLQQNKVKALTKPYAYAICGDPIKQTFKNGIFSLKWTANKNCFNKHTEIYLSQHYYFGSGFTHSFSQNCKGCTMNLLDGQEKNYYEVKVPVQSLNNTISLTVSQKEQKEYQNKQMKE